MRTTIMALFVLSAIYGCSSDFDMEDYHIALQKSNYYIEKCTKGVDRSACDEASKWTEKALPLTEEFTVFDDKQRSSLIREYGTENSKMLAADIGIFGKNIAFYNRMKK